MKLVSAFRVGKSDLGKGNKIKFTVNTLNNSNGYSTTISTDDIVAFENSSKINDYIIHKN